MAAPSYIDNLTRAIDAHLQPASVALYALLLVRARQAHAHSVSLSDAQVRQQINLSKTVLRNAIAELTGKQLIQVKRGSWRNATTPSSKEYPQPTHSARKGYLTRTL